MKEIILELINESPVNVGKLHDLLAQMNTVDIAEIFEHLSNEKALQVFRILPKSMAADVFSYIEPHNQQTLVAAMSDDEIGKILDELFVDDAVDFIEEMPANAIKRLLQNIGEDKRQLINQFLQYPPDSAGGIMSAEYVDLREDLTVREAFDYIRKNKTHDIYTCYVVRRDKLLTGSVSLKTLLLAKQHEKIGDLMETKVVFAHTLDDQEKAAELFRKYSLLYLPVVDKEQRLVGIITADDVVTVMEEEATEDFEKMAAIYPSEKPYLKTGVLTHSRNRIVWLLILMLSATITGAIIAGFESSLAVLPVLMTFVPMLMDTSGNAGCQTSTLVIRGMALGEIGFHDVFKVLWLELRVALLCGTGLAAVNFLRVMLTSKGNAMLSFTISITLIAVVIMAKSIACILPILAKKLKLDPAVLAGPIVTTILDGTSLLIYFSFARLLLKIQA
ncbi:MAG: magnesium transporter [Clostridiales bacterium]|nr:magnesium transporter [Clostridiales bacterium]